MTDTLPSADPATSAVREPLANAALTGLAIASSRLHPDDIATVAAEYAAMMGLADLRLYLSDLEQRVLLPMGGPVLADLEPLSIDGTVAGRAYRTETTVVSPAESGENTFTPAGGTAWLPLLDSAERLGVVSVRYEMSSTISCRSGAGPS